MDNEKIEELKERLSSIQERAEESARKQDYNKKYLEDLKLEEADTKDIKEKDEVQQRINEATAKKEQEEEIGRQIEAEREEVFDSIRAEMDQNQADIESKKKKIESYQKKIEKIQEEGKQLVGKMEQYGKVLTLMKEEPSSKVYTSAKEENELLLKEARKKMTSIKRNQNKIKKLTAEIEDLESHYASLKELLGKKEEVIEEPDLGMKDEYWEEYRAEVDSENVKAKEGGEKDYEEHIQEQKEQDNETFDDIVNTVYEISKYDAKLGIRGDNPEVFVARVGQEGEGEEPQKPDTQPENPFTPRRTGTRPPQQPNQKPEYQIISTGIESAINESGEDVPFYYVLLEDANGKKIRYGKPAFDYIQTVGPELKQQLEEKLITESNKYYDVGLATILEEVDEQFGTTGLQKYQSLIYNKFLKSPKQPEIDIDYNFSNLHKTSLDETQKEQMRLIKKIAKANKKLKLATYKKAPNAFQKLWYKITKMFEVPALPEGQEEVIEPNEIIEPTKPQETSLRDRVALGIEIQNRQREAAERARAKINQIEKEEKEEKSQGIEKY